MSDFHVEVRKETKDELELKFTERFYYYKLEDEDTRMLKETCWVAEDEKFLYRDVSSRELPEALREVLANEGVDAYTDESHPLIPGQILNVSCKEPRRELLKAIEILEKEWTTLKQKLLEALKG